VAALLREVVPPGRTSSRRAASTGIAWQRTTRASSAGRQRHRLERDPADYARPAGPTSPQPTLLLTAWTPTQHDPAGLLPAAGPGTSPGAVVVLRYRARSQLGKGSLAVYAGLPVAVPEGDTGSAANAIRSLGAPLPDGPADTTPNCWLYRCPAWVTPTTDWQPISSITESPRSPVG